jgi:hypothetical protein
MKQRRGRSRKSNVTPTWRDGAGQAPRGVRGRTNETGLTIPFGNGGLIEGTMRRRKTLQRLLLQERRTRPPHIRSLPLKSTGAVTASPPLLKGGAFEKVVMTGAASAAPAERYSASGAARLRLYSRKHGLRRDRRRDARGSLCGRRRRRVHNICLREHRRPC